MDGLILRTKSGDIIQNPIDSTANKATVYMASDAAVFGLTPSARGRNRD